MQFTADGINALPLPTGFGVIHTPDVDNPELEVTAPPTMEPAVDASQVDEEAPQTEEPAPAEDTEEKPPAKDEKPAKEKK